MVFPAKPVGPQPSKQQGSCHGENLAIKLGNQLAFQQLKAAIGSSGKVHRFGCKGVLNHGTGRDPPAIFNAPTWDFKLAFKKKYQEILVHRVGSKVHFPWIEGTSIHPLLPPMVAHEGGESTCIPHTFPFPTCVQPAYSRNWSLEGTTYETEWVCILKGGFQISENTFFLRGGGDTQGSKMSIKEHWFSSCSVRITADFVYFWAVNTTERKHFNDGSVCLISMHLGG